MERFADVEVEYEKNSNLKREDVKALRTWMEKQPHLPEISELMVALFLHSCYYKMEAAKNCVEKYYTIRGRCPEVFADRNVDAELIRQQIKLSLMTVLPATTKNGYRVLLTRLLSPNAEHYNHTEMIKLFDMMRSLEQMQFGSCPGVVVVMDFVHLSFAHVLKINLAVAKTFMFYVQEAMPVRLKEIHLVNVSPISDKVFAISKAFIKKELIDMIHTHTSISSLYDYIPKEALPHEYGGQAGSVREIHERTEANLIANAEYFKKEETEITDETKRTGKPTYVDDVFGIEGTFKKLDID